VKALHDGGVRLLFGTDAPQQFSVPGFSMHREMAVLRQAGLTPYTHPLRHSALGDKECGRLFRPQGPLWHRGGGPARRFNPGP
jgi:hypothetical protein